MYDNILQPVGPTAEHGSFMRCQTCKVFGGNEINLLRLKIVIQIVYWLNINSSYVSQSVKCGNIAGQSASMNAYNK